MIAIKYETLGFMVLALICIAVQYHQVSILCKNRNNVKISQKIGDANIIFSSGCTNISIAHNILLDSIKSQGLQDTSGSGHGLLVNRMSYKKFFLIMLLKTLLLSGDIQLNPGPIKYPCGAPDCGKPVKSNQKGIQCDSCLLWYHTKCIYMSDDEYYTLGTSDMAWYCYKCCLPPFTDSFFEELTIPQSTNLTSSPLSLSPTHFDSSLRFDNSPAIPSFLNSSDLSLLLNSSLTNLEPSEIFPFTDNSINSTMKTIPPVIMDINSLNLEGSEASMEEEEDPHYIKELLEYRKGNLKNLIISQYNVNSFRYKYFEFRAVLDNKFVDLCHICETKLDDSFKKEQFSIYSFKMYRRDRDENGGGQIVYIRSDLPSRRLEHLESTALESIVCEVQLRSDKWGFVFVYRPPGMNDNTAISELDIILNKVLTKYDYIFLSGDINFNLLDCEKEGKLLAELLNVYGMKNLVKSPTCFKSVVNPSMVDVLCTNAPNLFCKSQVWDLGISDFHKMTTVVKKGFIGATKPTNITYRSFKHFDKEAFIKDVSNIPYYNPPTGEVDSYYYAFNSMFNDIIDEHIPLKTKKLKMKPCNFMNSRWRKAINKRNMLRNRYYNIRSKQSWENYRQQRNLCTRIRRESVNQYFLERCAGGPKSRDFWPTVKPFLSKNCVNNNDNIFLCEDEVLITEPDKVCNVFNNFYVNVANDIGQDAGNYKDDFSDHPSILAINDVYKSTEPSFTFKHVKEAAVCKYINALNPKKAAGHDGISSKLLKLCSTQLTPHITSLINHTIENHYFPDTLKMANVTPVFKKENHLDKSKYRPVSILPSLSKVYEKVIADQLNEHMDCIFSKMLSAYRKGRSCQHVLIDLIEEWRSKLDIKNYVGAVLMDLSKAFDCLPHDLLMAKLKAYGLGDDALGLISSYLKQRLQRVKVGSFFSLWENILKGVPQGSILGPLLFNIFMNDIFYVLKSVDMKNYADDNTITDSDPDLDTLKAKLTRSSLEAIDWFRVNQMQANPEKFHCILLGSDRKPIETDLTFGDIKIKTESEVDLLGITIDDKLSFDSHITKLVDKAAKQLNAVKRIGHFLPQDCRMVIFRSFVLSNFNYCPLVWHFCGVKNTEKLEKIQKRGLQFVFRDYTSDYETLLGRCGLDSLQLSRLKTLACEVYKTINDQGPSYLKEVFKIRNTTSILTLRGEKHKDLEVPTIRTETFGRHSLRSLAPEVWNSIPSEHRKVVTLDEFKELLDTWAGVKCKCQMCRT